MSVKVIGGWYPCQTTQEITHADATEHSVTMESIGIPLKATVVYFTLTRSGGIGDLEVKSQSGGTVNPVNDDEKALWFRAEDGNFYYELETANDDVNCEIMGYFIQGSLSKALKG